MRYMRKTFDDGKTCEVSREYLKGALRLYHRSTHAEAEKLVKEAELPLNEGHRYQGNIACYWVERGVPK